VLADIQRVLALAQDKESHFVEIAGRDARRKTEQGVKKAKAEYAKAEKRVRQLDDIINQIYEDKVGGEISTERFSKMLEKYELEQAELTVKMDELHPAIEQAEADAQGIDKFLRMVRRFTEIKELTAEVVSEFIERIEIGETVLVAPRRFSHWKDEKRQNVRIVYNYIGTVPQAGETVTAETSEKATVTV
jgi:hypothetical protein